MPHKPDNLEQEGAVRADDPRLRPTFKLTPPPQRTPVQTRLLATLLEVDPDAHKAMAEKPGRLQQWVEIQAEIYHRAVSDQLLAGAQFHQAREVGWQVAAPSPPEDYQHEAESLGPPQDDPPSQQAEPLSPAAQEQAFPPRVKPMIPPSKAP